MNKNFINPCNHIESHLSASTLESFIQRTKQLDVKYLAVTDNGHLSSVLKAYKQAKKEDIRIIPGIEIFFKDDDCPIIKNTRSQEIKYFKLVVHFRDQQAYQNYIKISSSPDLQSISISGSQYPLLRWTDLIEIAKSNVSICTSDIEGMVAKHLLVGRVDLSVKYYLQLKHIFGADRFYPSLILNKYDKYWESLIKIKLKDREIVLNAKDRIDIKELDRSGKWKDTKSNGINLNRFTSRDKKLINVYVGGVQYKIKEEFSKIYSCELSNDFQCIPGGADLQKKANKLILALADKYSDQSRLLINSNSYYANKEDKIVQDMKLGGERKIPYDQHVKSSDEAIDYLENELNLTKELIDKLIDNSYAWAHHFDNFELKYDYKLVCPEGDPKKILLEAIKQNGRMKWNDPRYTDQLKKELDLLCNNGVINLIPYFLPIIDIYDFYSKNGYLTGPARGSAGGFLISYLVGITHIDPIKYELSSSRFLTLDRVQQGNLPDIDCDFESRDPLVGGDGNSGYLQDKYGNKIAQCSTRTLLRIKSAILDANRYISGNIEDEVARFSKSLPTTPQGINDRDYIFGYIDSDGHRIPGLLEQNEGLQKYAVERPKEWDLVKKSLSLSRQLSRHACAFVISNGPIEDTVPIMQVGDVKRVTQPEHKECEYAGLIKYDFLVVSALKDINLCIKNINRNINRKNEKTGYFYHDDKLTYIWDLPEDGKVFEMLSAGHTESVFQLNTVSVAPFIKRIRPKSILDCATITALVRPGPLDFVDPKTGRNMAEEYIYRRHGQSNGEIEVLNKLLPETYGILIFQESVSKIASELGQMDVIDAENVRIAMGKKKIKLLNSLKPKFIEGATKQVDQETAEKVWSMMATFSRYGFNKSHAVAYSVISYACAFLKHHYPLEWWAAVLSNADKKEINEVFYKYTKNILLPPDINNSTENLYIDYNRGKIRHKLSIISGLGGKTIDKIIANRPYKDIEDFVRKGVCGDKLTKQLIHVNVLDSLFDKEDGLYQKIHKFNTATQKISYEKKIEKIEEDIKNCNDSNKLEKLVKKKETIKEKMNHIEISENDSSYFTMSPKEDFILKKSIFPTMNIDLFDVLKEDSSLPIIKGNGKYILEMPTGKSVPIFSGQQLQLLNEKYVGRDVYFAVPGYVIDMNTFPYHNNTKKALKMVIDSSGYISEFVKWPDYNTNELSYPKNLKKGSIAWFLYKKRSDKENVNLLNIFLEK